MTKKYIDMMQTLNIHSDNKLVRQNTFREHNFKLNEQKVKQKEVAKRAMIWQKYIKSHSKVPTMSNSKSAQNSIRKLVNDCSNYLQTQDAKHIDLRPNIE